MDQKKHTKGLVLSALMAALAVVILILGNLIGVGSYSAALLAGLCLIPVGQQYGKKFHTVAWIVTGLLSFVLVSDIEETLMFLCVFGWYPICRKWFERFSKPLRLLLKLLIFNVVSAMVEALVILVLVPQSESWLVMILFFVIGSITFLLYDLIIPGAEDFFRKRILR